MKPAALSDDRALLNQEAAAAALGLTNHKTLAQWRLRRKGPAYVRVGHCVRYRRADLDAFIVMNRVDPAVSSDEP